MCDTWYLLGLENWEQSKAFESGPDVTKCVFQILTRRQSFSGQITGVMDT